MYKKDKTNRITLRLNDCQMQYVIDSCEVLDVSPSEFLRMVINLSMTSSNKGGGNRRENEASDIYDII